MTLNSLSRIYAFNQQGRLPMSNQRSLDDYAEHLVHEYARHVQNRTTLPFHMLEESEQNELVRLYIEANDRDFQDGWFGGDYTPDSEFNCALLRLLSDDSEETRQNLSNVIRRNIVKSHQQYLQDVLDNAVESVELYYEDVSNSRHYG